MTTDRSTKRAFRLVMTAVAAALPMIAAVPGGTAYAAPATGAQAAQPAGAQPAGAQPAAAQTWASLMHRAVSPDPEAVRLQAALPTMRAAIAARVTDLKTAQTGQATAAARLTAATASDRTAAAGEAAAKKASDAAYAKLVSRRKQRPYRKDRVAATLKAANAAAATLKQRTAAATTAEAALSAAQTAAQASALGLGTATVAWRTATVALRNAQQKISTAGYQPGLAVQAAAISKDVVTQVRASFTIADTTKVYGITVNQTMAYPFQKMLDDARKAGIVLSGGGFRTEQQQIALRIANGCPDIWTAPASSCKTPTAIPGHSMHEIGLAVDLTTGGRTITSHSSPAWQWLNAHAAAYGFANLPSEPWHWSITGN